MLKNDSYELSITRPEIHQIWTVFFIWLSTAILMFFLGISLVSIFTYNYYLMVPKTIVSNIVKNIHYCCKWIDLYSDVIYVNIVNKNLMYRRIQSILFVVRFFVDHKSGMTTDRWKERKQDAVAEKEKDGRN